MTLGGDHTIPYGMVRAASEVYGKLALLHFDSHQDSWPSHGNYSHANFAYDLWEEGCIDDKHSVQCYIRTDFEMEPGIPVPEYNIIFAPEALDLGPEALAEKIKSIIGDMPVYLTFDIDSIDPALYHMPSRIARLSFFASCGLLFSKQTIPSCYPMLYTYHIFKLLCSFCFFPAFIISFENDASCKPRKYAAKCCNSKCYRDLARWIECEWRKHTGYRRSSSRCIIYYTH